MANNKIQLADGRVLLDLTGDTVSDASHIMSGYVGHLRDGSQVTGTGSAGTQSDWEEEDSTDLAYVLNRPAIRAGDGDNSIVEGQIEDDETSYAECTIYVTGDANATTFTYTTNDDLTNFTASGSYIYYPNGIYDTYRYKRIISIDKTNQTLELSGAISTSAVSNGEVLIRKYASNVSSYRNAHAEGSYTLAIGNSSHAEGYITFAGVYAHAEGHSSKATENSAHAEGYNTTASSYYSHAEGSNTTASGNGSHAEGSNTTASGTGAHAEGYNTTASNSYSHAEGSGTTASGNYTHAEGYNTIASGYYSHAEGYNTTASGQCAHSEGYNTTTNKAYSHVEGFNTVVGALYQHVQGKYNVSDSTSAFIIGNGTNENARSNAYTLDWSGNGVYAGKVTVGTAPTADMDVATKKYVDDTVSGGGGGGSSTLSDLSDTTISSPTDGQLLKYNATTSKWENVTLSLALSGNTIQLKEGSTVIASITLPVYSGGVS